MPFVPLFPRSAVFTALCGLVLLLPPAQTFAAPVPFAAPAAPAAPAAAMDGTMAMRPRAADRRRMAEDRLLYARVRDGVYTVDGMVAKLKLNYDVDGAAFLYLFVPGVGTAVISASPEPDALMSPAAVSENELTFTVDGHHFGLSGVSLTNDRGRVPDHLYVRLDRSAWRLSRLPMVGFGDRASLPYEWPGALPLDPAEESEAIPPLPSTLLPSLAPPTPAGHPAVNVDPTTTPPAPHPASLR